MLAKKLLEKMQSYNLDARDNVSLYSSLDNEYYPVGYVKITNKFVHLLITPSITSNMKYKDLLNILSRFPDRIVAARNIAINNVKIADKDNDVLDPGHIYLVF